MELIETEKLIPSRYIRDELNKNGFQLSDVNKTTMIWNDEQLSYAEKLSELQKLCDSTSDSLLKKQIGQRLDYESKKLERIKDNFSGKFIYVFEEDEFVMFKGYFTDYETALHYALKCISKRHAPCSIYKKRLVSSNDESDVNAHLHLPGKSVKLTDINYYNLPISEIRFDEKGNISYLYCGEMSAEEEYDTYEYRKDRFEQNCFAIPIKFSCGTIVRDVTDNSLAVIAGDADFSKAPSDESYFSYFGVPVLMLDKHGMWDHTHIRPIYLEKAEPLICDTDDKKDRTYIKAINSFSDCLKAGLSEEEPACLKAIADAREYRDIYLEYSAELEKQVYNDVDTAVRLEDIMN